MLESRAAETQIVLFPFSSGSPPRATAAESLIAVMNNVSDQLITQPCPARATWARINVICTGDPTLSRLFQSERFATLMRNDSSASWDSLQSIVGFSASRRA